MSIAYNERGDSYRPMPADDPAAWMLDADFCSTPVRNLYRSSCYICRDPEFAQMGLPLCYPCNECSGHVPADDVICENGHDNMP